LPATIKEVSAIANTFPNTVNLIESAFSFSATEAQTPKHNILHLDTYAQFNGNPNTSFIYCGNVDTVSLSNIKV
jgi:CHAT domain-containing protein